MSIQSLGGLYGPSIVTPRPTREEGSGDAVRQPRVDTPAPREVERKAGSAGASASARELPLEAPSGTDPDLWSVLTSEERRYFAQARSMGPVTYGKSNLGLAELGLKRGGRLDVRV